MTIRLHRCLAATIAGVLAIASQAVAEDGFNPFNQLDTPGSARRKPVAQPRAETQTVPANGTSTPTAATPTGATGPNDDWPDQGELNGDAKGAQALPPQQWPAANVSADAVRPMAPPADQRNRGIERGELAPVIANDGSGLPFELWRGLDTTALEGQLTKLDIPPRSPAVHELWRRLITSKVTPPDGAQGQGRFDIMRAEALLRSGLLTEASRALDAEGPATGDPLRNEMAAKTLIGLGKLEKGCELAKALTPKKKELPKQQQSEALLMAGLCAAAGGNSAGAGLIADLAREEKSGDNATLAILDAVAAGMKTPVRGLKSVSLLVYRALALAGGVEAKDVIEHGEPALLAALARDPATPPSLRVAATEAAARINALSPDELAGIYREVAPAASSEALLSAGAAQGEPGLHRASLFKAAETERTPLKKVRLMRALLDDGRRSGLYLQTLVMLAKPAEQLQPVPEIGWFAESGVEIALASGAFDRARQWTTLGGAVPGDNGLRHWQALIDVSDPAFRGDRAHSLAPIEDLAAHGRMPPDLLHRLATVLDANDINVPIPLWEAASRAPQPTGGYLPETGVLSELQDAAKKREFGRTVLLVMRTLGPTGAEGANMIALGDSIRGLRRAGLEADAKRLSMEALFAQWPRNVVN